MRGQDLGRGGGGELRSLGDSRAAEDGPRPLFDKRESHLLIVRPLLAVHCEQLRTR